jgi:5-formyltetrahydrofolate cyclo-ligase
VATDEELIATGAAQGPGGVDWTKIRPDQFADIPFLTDLRQRMEMA